MGRTGYLVACCGDGFVVLCGLAARTGAKPSASSLQSKVAVAVARDLQFDSDEPGQPAPDTRSSGHVAARGREVARGLGARRFLAGKLAGAHGLRRAQRLPAVPRGVALDGLRRSRNPVGDPLSAAVQSRNLTAGVKQVRAPLAHSGDRMLLVEERPGMRLQARVVCLESGALGDAIRVRNLATHRVLLATIAGKNEVRVE